MSRRLAVPPHLAVDAPPPRVGPAEYMRNEGRFRRVEQLDPERFRRLTAAAEREAARRTAVYQQLAGLHVPAAS